MGSVLYMLLNVAISAHPLCCMHWQSAQKLQHNFAHMTWKSHFFANTGVMS